LGFHSCIGHVGVPLDSAAYDISMNSLYRVVFLMFFVSLFVRQNLLPDGLAAELLWYASDDFSFWS